MFRVCVVCVCAFALGASPRPARAGETPPAAVAAGPPAATPAFACPTAGLALGAGELPGGQGPADFTGGAEACGGNDVALWARGSLLPAARPARGESAGELGTLRARFDLAPRWWVTASVDLYTHAFAGDLPAAVGASTAGIFWGSTSVPAGGAWWGALGRAHALYLRVLLPTTFHRTTPDATGAELGVSGLALHRRWLATQASFALAVPAELGGGGLAPRLEVVEIFEAWVTGARIAASAGATARTDVAGAARWRAYALRSSTRVPIAGGAWLGLAAELPLPGSSTGAAAVGSLFLGWSR